MIAAEGSLLLRLVAPLVWRSERKIASKLEGFAATEAGSALDMLKAAELTDDPHLRQLFFRHAMDEARHAQMFRDAARGLAVNAGGRGSEYNLIHATRQNLYEKMGLTRFIAFVWLAEKRGELQFRTLRDHFRDHSTLMPLFERISNEEKFHVAYSAKLLETWRRAGQGRAVRNAIARVRFDRALQAWRRHGRMIGDAITKVGLSIIYLIVLAPFVLLQRKLEPARAGWQTRNEPVDPRRQF